MQEISQHLLNAMHSMQYINVDRTDEMNGMNQMKLMNFVRKILGGVFGNSLAV